MHTIVPEHDLSGHARLDTCTVYHYALGYVDGVSESNQCRGSVATSHSAMCTDP